MDASLIVPAVDRRKRISDETIGFIAHRIVSTFHPRQVILFGSYAIGTQKPESDLDILVVMDTALRLSDQARQIREALNPSFGLDLIVHTPATLKQRLNLGDFFLREVISTGKILYESSHD